jgi:hypothetical protein
MKLSILYFASFLSIIIVSCSSVQNTEKVIVDRRLVWDDFKGKVPDNSKYDSECWFDVKWEYSNLRNVNGKAVFDFTDLPYLMSKSWVRPEAINNAYSDTLLNHEIGHYNIAKAWARELRSKVRNTNFPYYNFEQKISSLAENINNKYLAMEKLYDDETNHSLNKSEQRRWDAKIRYLMNLYLPQKQ